MGQDRNQVSSGAHCEFISPGWQPSWHVLVHYRASPSGFLRPANAGVVSPWLVVLMVQVALDKLGLPCYHMKELIHKRPNDAAVWLKASRGDTSKHMLLLSHSNSHTK